MGEDGWWGEVGWGGVALARILVPVVMGCDGVWRGGVSRAGLGRGSSFGPRGGWVAVWAVAGQGALTKLPCRELQERAAHVVRQLDLALSSRRLQRRRRREVVAHEGREATQHL